MHYDSSDDDDKKLGLGKKFFIQLLEDERKVKCKFTKSLVPRLNQCIRFQIYQINMLNVQSFLIHLVIQQDITLWKKYQTLLQNKNHMRSFCKMKKKLVKKEKKK